MEAGSPVETQNEGSPTCPAASWTAGAVAALLRGYEGDSRCFSSTTSASSRPNAATAQSPRPDRS